MLAYAINQKGMLRFSAGNPLLALLNDAYTKR